MSRSANTVQPFHTIPPKSLELSLPPFSFPYYVFMTNRNVHEWAARITTETR